MRRFVYMILWSSPRIVNQIVNLGQRFHFRYLLTYDDDVTRLEHKFRFRLLLCCIIFLYRSYDSKSFEYTYTGLQYSTTCVRTVVVGRRRIFLKLVRVESSVLRLIDCEETCCVWA